MTVEAITHDAADQIESAITECYILSKTLMRQLVHSPFVELVEWAIRDLLQRGKLIEQATAFETLYMSPKNLLPPHYAICCLAGAQVYVAYRQWLQRFRVMHIRGVEWGKGRIEANCYGWFNRGGNPCAFFLEPNPQRLRRILTPMLRYETTLDNNPVDIAVLRRDAALWVSWAEGSKQSPVDWWFGVPEEVFRNPSGNIWTRLGSSERVSMVLEV